MNDSFSNTGKNPQDVASLLTRDKLKLQKELHELRLENAALKKQNHQMSVLLDSAVAKLEALGYSVIPPFDIGEGIRKLRALKETEMGEPELGTHIQKPVASSTQGRKFRIQAELKQHKGAVQCAAFSPDGRFLATGSFDKSCILWDFASTPTAQAVINGHSTNVSDLSWTNDGRNIVTASYDGTCCYWDVQHSTVPLHTCYGGGFILSCASMPLSPHLYVAADSKKNVFLVDTRTKLNFVQHWQRPNRVNTLCVEGLKGHRVATGDVSGKVAIFDIRAFTTSASPVEEPPPDVKPDATGRSPVIAKHEGFSDAVRGGAPQDEWLNEESRSSISHISVHRSPDETHRLIVLADDATARIYDQKTFVESETVEGLPVRKQGRQQSYTLRNLVTGVQSRSYPIRSDYRPAEEHDASFFDEDGAGDTKQRKAIVYSDLLVVGGTDNNAMVFDVTGSESSMIQKLEGHKDICYGALFHPVDPLIVTYSADATVKLWAPTKK